MKRLFPFVLDSGSDDSGSDTVSSESDMVYCCLRSLLLKAVQSQAGVREAHEERVCQAPWRGGRGLPFLRFRLILAFDCRYFTLRASRGSAAVQTFVAGAVSYHYGAAVVTRRSV